MFTITMDRGCSATETGFKPRISGLIIQQLNFIDKWIAIAQTTVIKNYTTDSLFSTNFIQCHPWIFEESLWLLKLDNI